MDLRPRLLDWYRRRFRSRVARSLLRAVTLPVGRQLSTDEVLAFESARMLNLAFAYLHNEGIEGDYAEFGVYRGTTFVEACQAARLYRRDAMRFLAFDSFEGLPAPEGIDAGGPFRGSQYAFPRAEFERTLRRHRVPMARVDVVEGRFEETLPSPERASLPAREVALAWIDCDLYASAVPVLDFLTDRLVDGAVIVFDDWYTYKGRPDRGEQRACREWLRGNPGITLVDYLKYHWAGRSFIVNRDDA